MNGDQLSGTVAAEGDASITVDSPVFGRVTVKRVDVASLTRDQGPAPGVGGASSPGEPTWSGEASVGWNLSHGNSPASDLGTHAVITRAGAHDKLGLFGSSLDSSTGGADSRFTTVRAMRGGARYDRDVSHRTFLFGFGEAEHDLLQLLDLRTVVGGGAGLHVFKGDYAQFNIVSGASMARDSYTAVVTDAESPAVSVPPGGPAANGHGRGLATAPGQSDRDGTPPSLVRTSLHRRVGEWFAGQDLWQQVTSGLDVNERLDFFAAAGDAADYRVSFDLGVGVQLNGWLQWNVDVTDRYLHIPPAGGAVQNDLFVSSGMGISFGRGAEGAYTGANARPPARSLLSFTNASR